MTRKTNAVLWCILILFCITLGGGILLTKSVKKETVETSQESNESDTGFVVMEAGSYDSADTAVVIEKDKENSTVTFQNMQVGKQYTLTFNGATQISDKYSESMSMEQIKEGDVVDITFLKDKKKLNSMQLSSKSWVLSDVSKYNINELAKQMTIAEDIYKITGDTVIVSSGKQAEVMDINATDVLKVSGVGHNIYSIVVDKGHGYLRLTNEEYFVGGWIEIGQSVIQEVTDDMLLVVPEGTYNVTISHKGNSGTKKVIINRNEEVELDVGDLKGEEPQFGTVLFTVSPSDAEVYIDGDKTDISEAVTLEYGIHQMIVKAEGYDTITQYIKVGQEAAGIDVTMEKSDKEDDTEEETEDESVEETESESSSADKPQSSESESKEDKTEKESESESNSSGNNNTTVSGNDSKDDDKDSKNDKEDKDDTTDITGNYKVYLDAPYGVEAYVDGNYVGVIPCSFKKSGGSHVVTLRMTGYLTRSYTIQLDDEQKDINYSFSELEKSEE